MIRLIALAMAGPVLLGLTLVSTDVSAARRGGGGGHASSAHIGGGGHGGGFRTGGFRSGGGHTTFRRFGYGSRIGIYGYPYRHGYSCWRWRMTHLGLRRVWVCGYPYRRYGY